MTDIDVTGAEAFESTKTRLDERGVVLAFSRVRPEVRARLSHLGLLTNECTFATNRAATAALAHTETSTESKE